MTSNIQSKLFLLIVKACRFLPALYHRARLRLGLVRQKISDDELYTLAFNIFMRCDQHYHDYIEYDEYWCTDFIFELADELMDDINKLDEFRCEVEIPLRCEMGQTRKNKNFVTLRRLMYRMRANIHLLIVKYLRYFDALCNRSINEEYTDQFVYDLSMTISKLWPTYNRSQSLKKIIDGGFLDDLKSMEECREIINGFPRETIFEMEHHRKYRDSLTDVRRGFIIHS